MMCAAAIPNLMVVSLDPQPPAGLDEKALMAPETVGHWPVGLFPGMMGHVWRGQTDPNWGNALGLKGFWSLTPLIALWGAAMVCWAALARAGGGTPCAEKSVDERAQKLVRPVARFPKPLQLAQDAPRPLSSRPKSNASPRVNF